MLPSCGSSRLFGHSLSLEGFRLLSVPQNLRFCPRSTKPASPPQLCLLGQITEPGKGHWAGAMFAKTGSLFRGCGWGEALMLAPRSTRDLGPRGALSTSETWN